MSKKNERLFERDGWRCTYCAKAVQHPTDTPNRDAWATRDHCIPTSRGGRGGANIVTACLPCNTAKKDRTGAEFREWRLVRMDCEETRL